MADARPKPTTLPHDRFRVLLWCSPVPSELRRPEWAWRIGWREEGAWRTADEHGIALPEVSGDGDWLALPPPPKSVYGAA